MEGFKVRTEPPKFNLQKLGYPKPTSEWQTTISIRARYCYNLITPCGTFILLLGKNLLKFP